MIEKDNDGWEEVTDPHELKIIGGVKAVDKAAEAARRNAATAANGQAPLETANNRDKANAALALIDRVEPALNRVSHLQKTNLGRTGVAGLLEYAPFVPSNQEYDAAASLLTALVRPAMRSPGEGSMSDFESKLAVQPLPDRYNTDRYNNEAINGLRTFLDTSRKLYRAQAGLPKPPPSTAARSRGWKIERVK